MHNPNTQFSPSNLFSNYFLLLQIPPSAVDSSPLKMSGMEELGLSHLHVAETSRPVSQPTTGSQSKVALIGMASPFPEQKPFVNVATQPFLDSRSQHAR
ncbi:hypothetical protein VNO78_07826 [Psophocarpus tetragonolobus]|uniref:Uncharacterized protein n=1 Tax=Psophocarpus tetragonolobus TaxID=3891 RepID=A0AAN9XT42_PSOTE